jgi:hypothetical protein
MAKTIGQLTSATTIANGDLFVIEQSSQTFKIAASVVRGGLVDADVDAAAAIVYSKLDLDDSIVTGDLTDDAVTTAKIDDDAVTTAKILDANVTTGKVADAAIIPAKLSQPYTLATVQASTSGTSIDFTSIPSWAKRITVMFAEVSTSGTSDVLVQLGDAGGIENTGYVSTSNIYNNASGTAGVNRTDGFAVYYASSTHLLTGHMLLTKIDANSWVSSHAGKLVTTGAIGGAGSKTLSDTLTQVRITTVNADTFDAGSINISYEG